MFNARTGAVIVLDGPDVRPLSDSLLDSKRLFVGLEFSETLLTQLLHGGYLIPNDFDELEVIRERYWGARDGAPVVVTITTTMECNLGCYYCYEKRSGERLTTEQVGTIVDLALRRVEASGRKALHVDWYGGEPLLNLELIEQASAALQNACTSEGISYVSSIISNGTAWPDDVEAFVARHKIRQAQISFDGLRYNHDKRRRFRKGFGSSTSSSFSPAVALVDGLVQCVRVDLRFNMDKGNRDDLLPFIHFARARGWFKAPYPAVFQPARLAAYSKASSFMHTHQLPLAEFDRLRALAREELGEHNPPEESEVPDGYPFPKSSVCAALASNSVVLGADGLSYRCGLQVGEPSRAVGRVAGQEQDVGRDAIWWETFDPTELPSCSSCSFLPICWGGCPKKQLEGDQVALAEQGLYWRMNLPRLIGKAAGFPAVDDHAIPESLQFR